MAESNGTSRQRLLDAGREALMAGDIDVLADGITIEQVAVRAGLSTQTFHNVYPRTGGRGGKEQYLTELAHALAASSPTDSATDRLPPIAPRSLVPDPIRRVRELAKWTDAITRDGSGARVRTLVWALTPHHGPANSAVQATYRETTTAVADALSMLLRELGASLRQPFTLESLATAMIAMAEGLVVRGQSDRSAVPGPLLGDAALALVAAVIDGNHLYEHIEDVMAVLVERAGTDQRVDRALPDDPEKSIIDAAATEFAMRGYVNTQQIHIADRAGVDLATVRQIFPTISDIVVGGLRPVMETLERKIAIDVRLDRTPIDIVTRYTLRLAEMMIVRRSFVEALVLLITLHTAHAPVNTSRIHEQLFFPGLIAPVIERAQADGTITSELTALEIAAALTNNVMFRCISRRDETADAIGEVVNTIVLDGTRTRAL